MAFLMGDDVQTIPLALATLQGAAYNGGNHIGLGIAAEHHPDHHLLHHLPT